MPRLPLIAELDSRDGSSNKDSRLTNVLNDIDEGANYAAIRPGLLTQATYSGIGGGLIDFDKILISVYGDVINVLGYSASFDLSAL